MAVYEKLKRLGKESVVYGVGNALGKFLGFLLLPVFTRVFSPSDYGVLDVIATMTALAGIVLTSGMETALSYYFFRDTSLLERRVTVTTVAAYLVGINVAVAAVVWMAAEPIAHMAFLESGYAGYLRVAILALPFTTLHSLNLNVLRLQRRPWPYLGLSLPNLLLSVLLNILLVVVFRVGIVGVFITNVIVNAVTATAGVVLNRHMYGLVFDTHRLRALLAYGLPLVIGGLSMWTINYLDRYFLIRFTTMAEVGLYSVGLRLASAVAIIAVAFRIANAPFQFETHQNDADAANVYARTLDYYLLLMVSLVVGLGILARPVLRILTPADYYDAYRVVAISALALVAYGTYQLVGVGLLVTRRTGYTGAIIGLGAVVNIGMLFILIPPLGFVGAALATLLTHVLVAAGLYYGSQRAYPVAYDIPRMGRTITAAGIVISIDLLRTSTGMPSDLAFAVLLGILYLVLMRVFGLVTPAERLFMKRRLLDVCARYRRGRYRTNSAVNPESRWKQ